MLMEHDGTSEEMKKIRARQTIQNDVMGDEEFREFLHNAFRAAGEVMRPGAAYYIWHSDTKGLDFRTAASEEIGQIREVLIWNKRNIVVGRQDYQWKHEPCLYGWKEGAGHYFINSRTEATVWEDQPDLDKITKAEAIELLRQIYAGAMPTTIIDEQQPRRSRLHPTMKPVALIGYQVANSSRRGEAVLDLFGGSGTTLIACQQLGRRCYMMEYDPHYCDVIIDRWEQFTGEKAVQL